MHVHASGFLFILKGFDRGVWWCVVVLHNHWSVCACAAVIKVQKQTTNINLMLCRKLQYTS